MPMLSEPVPDVVLTEDQIATCTDRDQLEQHKAQLLRSGTEPGWIESYWVHRVSFHGHPYRQRYWRRVYRNELGQLVRQHIPVSQTQEYRQRVANRRRVERINQRLQQLEEMSQKISSQKTLI